MLKNELEFKVFKTNKDYMKKTFYKKYQKAIQKYKETNSVKRLV